ncbi:MAG: hypothetical protein K2Q32_07415 [Alphaproteobacteria bacterium]|nr:hypothetical protein [Alphaproteobacteria bacterium]
MAANPGNPFAQFPQPARFMAESRTPAFNMSIPGVDKTDARKALEVGGAFAFFDRMSQNPEYMAQVKALKQPPIPSIDPAKELAKDTGMNTKLSDDTKVSSAAGLRERTSQFAGTAFDLKQS